MLRKLIVLAIASGLAARLYRSCAGTRAETDVAASPLATRRRRAGTGANGQG
ncbi:hypothetical protein [Polaromonas sp.]|uniref:hypothetical protein n=1 Tax=Polaromonas sp. TaxID=1869339 RepID=UPI0035693B55